MLNPIHIPDGLGIEHADFGELGDVRDLDPHLGILGIHPAEGLGQVEADLIGIVDIADQAVGVVGPHGLAPQAGRDDQGSALLGGQIVFQHIGHDGALGILGDLPGHQQAELLDGDQNVVGQGIAGAVAGPPGGRDDAVDVVQNLVRGLVRPPGGVAGAGGGSGHPGDPGAVDEAGGVHLGETDINRAVDGLIAVEADALIEEGFRIPADVQHLLALQGGEGHILGEVEAASHGLAHVRLDDGDIVGGVEDQVILALAAGAIGHVHGDDGFQQAAAGDDGHIPGPVGGGQGLPDLLVHLLQLLHEEGIGVVGGQAGRSTKRMEFSHAFSAPCI